MRASHGRLRASRPSGRALQRRQRECDGIVNVSDYGTRSAIRVEEVVKRFGDGPDAVQALSTVSLDIRNNEFFTLLGPSGCGKTTLLRIMAGFERLTSGRLYLFDEEIADLPPFQRPVNMVFQQYALFPHMTVAENIAFGLKRLKRKAAEIDETVSRVLGLVKLEQFGNRKPEQLSGGQQQRVALARALAPGPKVLLLDEPLSALDLKLRQAMRHELKELQRQTGITFIFVTHDQEEALSMSDRIAVMSDGEVQQVGEPEDIYEFPANRFVADFIGDANFIEAEVVGTGDGRTACRVLEGTVLNVVDGQSVPDGDKVSLFLRPEKIVLATELSGDGSRSFTGRVLDIDYVGDSTTYRLAIEGDVELLVRSSSRAGGGHAFAMGQDVCAIYSEDSLRLLTT